MRCAVLAVLFAVAVPGGVRGWGFPSRAAVEIDGLAHVVADWRDFASLDGGAAVTTNAISELGRLGFDACVVPLLDAVARVQATINCDGSCCSFSGPGGVNGYAAAVRGFGAIGNSSRPVVHTLTAIANDTRKYCDGQSGEFVQSTAAASLKAIASGQPAFLGAPLPSNGAPCVDFRLLDGTRVRSADTSTLVAAIEAAVKKPKSNTVEALTAIATDMYHCDGNDGYTVQRAALTAIWELTDHDPDAKYRILNTVLTSHAVRGDSLLFAAARIPTQSAQPSDAVLGDLLNTAFGHPDEGVRAFLAAQLPQRFNGYGCQSLCSLCDMTRRPDMYAMVRYAAKTSTCSCSCE